jgi:hypothetical protein
MRDSLVMGVGPGFLSALVCRSATQLHWIFLSQLLVMFSNQGPNF